MAIQDICTPASVCQQVVVLKRRGFMYRLLCDKIADIDTEPEIPMLCNFETSKNYRKSR